MNYQSKYTGEQVEQGVQKALEDLVLEGATVNIQIVDENTTASGSVTKEEGSNRARFDFKIPGISFIPKFSEINKSGVYYISDSDMINLELGKNDYFAIICVQSDGSSSMKIQSESLGSSVLIHANDYRDINNGDTINIHTPSINFVCSIKDGQSSIYVNGNYDAI